MKEGSEYRRFLQEDLFVAQSLDGIHAGGAHGREKPGDDAYDGQDDEGDEHDGGRGAEDDVALVVCGLVHV